MRSDSCSLNGIELCGIDLLTLKHNTQLLFLTGLSGDSKKTKTDLKYDSIFTSSVSADLKEWSNESGGWGKWHSIDWAVVEGALSVRVGRPLSPWGVLKALCLDSSPLDVQTRFPLRACSCTHKKAYIPIHCPWNSRELLSIWWNKKPLCDVSCKNIPIIL